MSTIKKADLSHSSGIQAHLNEKSSQIIPDSVVKAKRTNLRRRSPRQVSVAQPQGVQKTRNSNRRQIPRLMKAAPTITRKQKLFRFPTPQGFD